ncbi:MAG: cell division protein ZapA [Candidatus Aerophobetes bacterium]|nr:cell division protein ZapA [Candidatus Aerophobetes bacterium]
MRVYIFDREYNLKADEDEEHLKTVANYVDSRMRMVSSAAPQKKSEEISVLACLNIADELHRLKTKNKRAKERIEKVIEKIEKEVK